MERNIKKIGFLNFVILLLAGGISIILARYCHSLSGQVAGVFFGIGAFVALDDGLEGLLHLSEMGDGSLKEPYSYVKKGDRMTLRISHLEPEKRRVGFTQRWGTEDEATAPAASGWKARC